MNEQDKLFMLMAAAEQQQEAVNQAIQQLKVTQHEIKQIIASQTKASVSHAIVDGLKDGTNRMAASASKLSQLNQAIEKNLDKLT